MVFNVGATVLYITAFITCSASVEPTSLKGSRPYNQRAAASVSMVPWGTLGSDRAEGQSEVYAPGLALLPDPRPGTCHRLNHPPAPSGLTGVHVVV